MHIIKLIPCEPGVYSDHSADHITMPPEGWAYIPEDFSLPSTFPRLGSLEAEEKIYTREVEVQKEVTKTRQVPQYGEDGSMLAVMVTEEYKEMETVIEEREYTMMTVTKMTEGTLPKIVKSVEQQIAELKAELEATDYKVIKCYEAQLKGTDMPYDITTLCDERQAIRDQINTLEGGNE